MQGSLLEAGNIASNYAANELKNKCESAAFFSFISISFLAIKIHPWIAYFKKSIFMRNCHFLKQIMEEAGVHSC